MHYDIYSMMSFATTDFWPFLVECQYIIDMVTVLPMDECQYMIDKVCFLFLRSYFDHTSLVHSADYTNTCMNDLSASFCHLEVIIWTPSGTNAIYILLHISLINMALHRGRLLPSCIKKGNIIQCVSRMKNLPVIC
jgi:hypothetical protein